MPSIQCPRRGPRAEWNGVRLDDESHIYSRPLVVRVNISPAHLAPRVNTLERQEDATAEGLALSSGGDHWFPFWIGRLLSGGAGPAMIIGAGSHPLGRQDAPGSLSIRLLYELLGGCPMGDLKVPPPSWLCLGGPSLQ